MRCFFFFLEKEIRRARYIGASVFVRFETEENAETRSGCERKDRGPRVLALTFLSACKVEYASSSSPNSASILHIGTVFHVQCCVERVNACYSKFRVIILFKFSYSLYY